MADDIAGKLNKILQGDGAGSTSGASSESGIGGEAGLPIQGVVGIEQPKRQPFGSGISGVDSLMDFMGGRK